VRARVGRACVCASTSTCSPADCVRWEHPLLDAAARCISRITASTLPRGSTARGNAGSPCDAARFRGVPQRRVAARLASVAGYAGPDENVLLSRSKNLRKYKSVRLTLIIIGIVASVCHDEVFDFGQLLRT